jgi:hypothetical protein
MPGKAPPPDALRLRRLLMGRAEAGGDALESASDGAGRPGEHDVAAIAARIGAAAGALRAGAPAAGRAPRREATGLARTLVARADAALSALDRGTPARDLSGEDVVALEAVLHTRGRPAARVRDDRIADLRTIPGSEMWIAIADAHERSITAACVATGAVTVLDALGGGVWVQGTAWLVAPDLALTNRHVLFPPLGGARLARRVPGSPLARLRRDLTITLDFAHDDGPARMRRFSVTDIPFVAEDRDPVDAALLRVTPIDATAPAPLRLAPAPAPGQLYIVGHPGRMANLPDDVRAVFGDPDERKRVSFGMRMPDGPRADLVHDASTIGGFSGGCVLGLGQEGVVGLHYWGDPVEGNRAVTADALRGHATLGPRLADLAGP